MKHPKLTPEECVSLAKALWEEGTSPIADLNVSLSKAEKLRGQLAKKLPRGFNKGTGLCDNLDTLENWVFICRLVGLAALQFDWCDCSKTCHQVEWGGKTVSLPVFPVGGSKEFYCKPKWEGESLTKRRELLDAVIILLRGLIECLDQKEGREHAQ